MINGQNNETEIYSKKGWAPVAEEPKKPETKTQSDLEKIRSLETALDTEDSSCLDLSIQKPNQFSSSQPLIVVYIRPLKEEIKEFLKRGQSRVSYIFKGITAPDLKKIFLEALKSLKPKRYTEHRKEVFEYDYPIANKDIVYSSAKSLNKQHSN